MTEESFWKRVRKDLGPCWVWTGKLRADGYGCFFTSRAKGQPKRRMVRAHKWTWEQVNGPVPEGLELDHLCRNRACVRPDHMEAVTHAENVRRGRGGENHRSKVECIYGHPYTEENTIRRPNGTRTCRECGRQATRRYLERKRKTGRAS